MNPDPYRLLVVDDEETMRRSLADILRLEGYHVQSAADGDAAIALLARESFDLILLDLKMPGTNGIDVLRFAVGSTPANPEIGRPTVILLTAHGSLESAIQALRFGAHDYLLKPSSPEQILKSVAKGLETRAERRQKQQLIDQLETSVRTLRGLEETAGLGSKAKASGAELPASQPYPVYRLGGAITIDLARREIHRPGLIIKLTMTEGKLMKVFLENPKRVFSHRELVALVQGYDVKDWEAAGVLRPLISRLRGKLDRVTRGSQWVISVRGTGYVFDPPGVVE